MDADPLEMDADKTQPPVSALRFDTPHELYTALPQVAQLTLHRPQESDEPMQYLARLRASTTPEEAVTFIAFAALPKMAIWWGYECVRLSLDTLSQQDRAIMELVANWTNYPDNENRYRAAQAALYAPVPSPAVFLGLAVAWSGGQIAPNDPAPVPLHRAPRAINSAVLSALAKADPTERPVRLARSIDLAAPLFRSF